MSPARYFFYVCDEQLSACDSIIGMGVAFLLRNAGYVGLGGIWIREEGADWLRWGGDSVGVIAEESLLSLLYDDCNVNRSFLLRDEWKFFFFFFLGGGGEGRKLMYLPWIHMYSKPHSLE